MCEPENVAKALAYLSELESRAVRYQDSGDEYGKRLSDRSEGSRDMLRILHPEYFRGSRLVGPPEEPHPLSEYRE